MTKKKDMALLIEGLRRISSDFNALADELEGKPSINEEVKPAITVETSEGSTPEKASEQDLAQEAPVTEESPAESETPAYTMQDVRKILADKSRNLSACGGKAVVSTNATWYPSLRNCSK